MNADQVQWVVYGDGDLGVQITDDEGNSQIFTLYKGRSLERTGDFVDTPHIYRPVGKREFGESITATENLPEDDLDEWFPA